MAPDPPTDHASVLCSVHSVSMTATVSQPIQAVEKVGNGTPPPAVAPAQMASQDVGLLFVREYYTFLNRKPSRLHAFYKGDSTFLRGHEGDPAQACHGSEVDACTPPPLDRMTHQVSSPHLVSIFCDRKSARRSRT